MRTLTFNGIKSSDLKLVVDSQDTYNSPALKYDKASIDGRNGDIIVSADSYENLDMDYTISCHGNLSDMTDAIKDAWNCLDGNYVRMEDSYLPNVYMLGFWNGEIEGSVSQNKAIKLDITINRKPQKFLISGEETVEFTESGTITNPTIYIAKPLLRVYGVGTIKVGGYTVTVKKGATKFIEIDCELEDAFEDLINRNNLVSITSEFPKLKKGENVVSLGEGIEKLEIIPRWWKR